MVTQESFTRQATGLVREFSPFDGFVYNWLTGCGVWSPVMIFVLYFGGNALPGANIPLGTLIVVAALIPIWLVYAMLGASIPRTGGDYVFNTRIIAPVVGFAMFFVQMIFTEQWNYWNAYAVGTLGLAPLAQLYGRSNFGAWIAGPGVIVLAISMILLTGFIMSLGLRVYLTLQRVLFYVIMISVVIFVGIVSITSNAHFVNSFNAFMNPILSSQNSYQDIINSANQAGFNTNPGFSLIATLGLMPFLAGTLIFAQQGVMNFGEVKRANSVRNTVFMIVGAGAAAGITLSVLFYLILNTFGQSFIAAIAYNFVNNTPIAQKLGSPPFFTFLAALVANPVLVWIMMIGVISGLFLFMPGIYIVGSRYLFGMSFDRVLPSFFSSVNQRFHAPLVAIGVMALLQIAWSFLYTYTSIGTFTSAVIFVSLTGMSVTALAAILFPYLKHTKDWYKASPASRYTIGKLPVIVLCGILALVMFGVFDYQFATVSALGANNPVSLAVMMSLAIVAALVYFVSKAYHRRHGVELAWAFKEIPPE